MSIKFACPRCKQSLRVPDELGGKKAKCPHCASTVGVPAKGVVAKAAVVPASSVPLAPANPKANPKAEFAGLNAPIQSPTGAGKPYQRQRGNPVMKLMFLTLALFLLGGGIYGAVHFNWIDLSKLGLKKGTSSEVAQGPGDTKPKNTVREGSTQPAPTNPKDPQLPPLTESHFFPDGTAVIASLNFESALGSKLYDKVKEEAAKMGQSPEKLFDMEMKPILGLQLTAISRITAAAVTEQELIQVIQPRNPVTIDQIKINKMGDYKEVKMGRFTLYEGAKDAYCLAEDRMLVVGPPALMKKVLERNKPAQLKPELEVAYRQINPAKTTGLAFLPQDALKEIAKAVPGGAALGKVPGLAEAQGFVFQLDLAKGLEIAATVQCKDAGGATELQKIVESGIAAEKKKQEQIQKESEVPEEVMRAKKTEELLGQIKSAVEGVNFTLSLALNDEMVTQLLDVVKGSLTKPASQ